MAEERKNESDGIIPSERRGLWIAVTFIIALLALVVSSVAIYRITIVTGITQIEIHTLFKRIDTLEMKIK